MSAQIESIVKIIRDHPSIVPLKAIQGIVGVRPGFSSDPAHNFEPVILVLTEPGVRFQNLPVEIETIKIEQRTASVLEMTEGLLPLSAWLGITQEAIPQINYVPPPEDLVKLEEMKVSKITCHVGPDSGWKTLKPFLEGTTQSLTVAMYEFYAPHIIEKVKEKGTTSNSSLNMILQVSSNDEEIKTVLTQSWGTRLNFAKASVSGSNRIFNNSYHTKVAVRDSKAFWLSSGNWSPNSQPLIAPGTEQVLYRAGNREWHVIVEDEALAQMYEKFIKYDMEQARAAVIPESAPIYPDLLVPDTPLAEAALMQPHPFEAKKFAATGPKIRVKPLMSPDNYAIEVLKLIQEATESLYLQFSYIRQPSQGVFDQIISAIAQKMRDGLDVKVLVNGGQKSEHSDLLIGQRGWNRTMFRRQSSKMHNKGILIDGKIAAVGSNNWSTDGTLYNRDTTLVFFSPAIAKYFTEVFLFDWNNLSNPIGSQPEIEPILAPLMGTTPLGMKRIPWQAWFDE